MEEFLQQTLPSLGIGGIIALLMFYFYRQDAKRNAERLVELIDRQESTSHGWVQIVQDNTKALTQLTERLANNRRT